MSVVFLVKVLAAPLMIAAASLAGKRWGPNIAGLMGGLPLVGGPVVLALWLSQGSAFATQVTLAAPVGVWANIAYMLLMAYASARFAWYIAIPIGWLGYVLAGLLLNEMGLAHSLWFGLAVLPGLWFAATRGLPKPAALPRVAHLPQIEIFTRMAAAAALVLSLTAVSSLFGPTLTGIFTGAPVAATVIPAFTFANAGRDALLLALRGFLTGLMGFTVFFYVLAYTIPLLDYWAFLPALLAGVAVGLLATKMARRAG
ncbi:hypothetical protein [Chitinimonas sp. BJB300]|uniref:hypothetical protein n=1 Tax=Chitinimonas sp. BJB300 TaxID=1559339 RepID=UPI000C0DC099|nr:hypothetical protein [Chitinimonas sp. BJB300]PHV13437.1 hypothetical protein CSQ89_00715 [Chitinimonas sp. BJB300]TSJ89756.1 hypothetical protein FG002_005930 [Chitinimonas sp. BJB300]